MPRSYEQSCGLALALDRVGGRWTLLIVRELLPAPARYTDLQRALPGIATNLLAERLRDLEEAGLIERAPLPAPASGEMYMLTPAARDLEPALEALALWGSRFMAGTPFRDPASPRGLVLAARALVRPEAAAGEHASVAFRFDDDASVVVRAADGRFDVELGPSEADATVRVGYEQFLRVCAGMQPVPRQGIEGDRRALAAIGRVFERAAALRG